MTKELSNVLKNLLQNISFLDVVAGIVQPVVDVKFKEDDGLRIAKKMPVSYDTTLGKSTFLGMERQLIPDKARKSIFYFEDFGSVPDPRGKAGSLSFITQIRAVCWLNKEKLGFDKYADVTARCIDEILHRLVTGTGINQSGITRLFIFNPRIAIQDASIFSRYNYDETVLQFLRPPFEYFAIDLTAKYEVRRIKCTGGRYLSNIFKQVTITVHIKDVPDATITQRLTNGWVVPLEFPTGTTLTLDFLRGFGIVAPFIFERRIVDPIPYNEDTATWDFSTTEMETLIDGNIIFINASLPASS